LAGIKVQVTDQGKLEKFLRLFKRLVQKSGIRRESKMRQRYEKPSEKKKRKQRESYERAKRKKRNNNINVR
jgi:small subunit ribosomal protein S21